MSFRKRLASRRVGQRFRDLEEGHSFQSTISGEIDGSGSDQYTPKKSLELLWSALDRHVFTLSADARSWGGR